MRLIDGFRAWRLLAKQRLNSSNIRATLYNMLLMPLFALSLMPILFFKIRPYRRFVKIEYIWVKTLGFSLLVWAFFFAMYRLGASGTVDPNIGQLLPTLILIFYSLIFYKRVN
ncbi:Permease YjgP/YjgQ [hydrothermal vent metagenome]|uniref:Permease YjgP/YjgQ n=1 Tax=hydrothermal vent metagenome TaxID=652676 RepID=A0A1W1D0A7_9ZZZZ